MGNLFAYGIIVVSVIFLLPILCLIILSVLASISMSAVIYFVAIRALIKDIFTGRKKVDCVALSKASL